MVMPGDNVQVEVELIHPIALNEGLRFAIREGGRTVGAGVVAQVLSWYWIDDVEFSNFLVKLLSDLKNTSRHFIFYFIEIKK